MIKDSAEAESALIHQRLRAYNRRFWRNLGSIGFI